jgi:hypothetical protein
MGVHRERLATSKAHTKAALQKWALGKLHREIPIAAISPLAAYVGEALGCRGALRFVEFGYSRTIRQSVPFCFC